jgi:hypothetical protein
MGSLEAMCMCRTEGLLVYAANGSDKVTLRTDD